MLGEASVATRIPVRDLGRARAFYADIDATVAELRRRGVEFAEDGIVEVQGNYPSKGGRGERANWFRDLDGNVFGVGQAVR